MSDNRIQFLADTLDQHRKTIENYVYPGRVVWEKLIATIRSQAEVQNPAFAGEQVWTFLMACGYALSGEAGLHELAKLLTGLDLPLPPQPKILTQTSPLPPRQKEGNTYVDLALATISRRIPTKSGIQLEVSENTWVCFCEMKYDSDISLKTTSDINRNQLLRVIENALCFQNSGKLADKIYVTLVIRKELQRKSIYRKYKKIFEDYQNNPNRIEQELNDSPQGARKQSNWHYPEDISELINKLYLNWISYEELFSRLPAPLEAGLNQVYQEIKRFWEFSGLSLKDRYQGLLDAETEAMAGGGVLSYTPLIFKLEECAQYKGERKRVALQYLPVALSCALQNDECLQDIKNVSVEISRSHTGDNFLRYKFEKR